MLSTKISAILHRPQYRTERKTLKNNLANTMASDASVSYVARTSAATTLSQQDNTLRPRRNGYFADDTFKRIFADEKVWKWINFHRSLFLGVQLTIFQQWFRQWPGAIQATSHYLKEWRFVCRRIYVLGLNELRVTDASSKRYEIVEHAIMIPKTNLAWHGLMGQCTWRGGVRNRVLMKHQTGIRWTGYPRLVTHDPVAKYMRVDHRVVNYNSSFYNLNTDECVHRYHYVLCENENKWIILSDFWYFVNFLTKMERGRNSMYPSYVTYIFPFETTHIYMNDICPVCIYVSQISHLILIAK